MCVVRLLKVVSTISANLLTTDHGNKCIMAEQNKKS